MIRPDELRYRTWIVWRWVDDASVYNTWAWPILVALVAGIKSGRHLKDGVF